VKLPVVSGSDAVKAFGRAGYELDEQPDPPHRRLSVPNHKELAKGRGRAYGGGVREAALV
jgi:hypothetical protein